MCECVCVHFDRACSHMCLQRVRGLVNGRTLSHTRAAFGVLELNNSVVRGSCVARARVRPARQRVVAATRAIAVELCVCVCVRLTFVPIGKVCALLCRVVRRVFLV